MHHFHLRHHFIQVYNDDLDEDNSDYVEEGDGDGEEDDDIDSEEDEATENATGQPQAPAAGLKNKFLFYICTGNRENKVGWFWSCFGVQKQMENRQKLTLLVYVN